MGAGRPVGALCTACGRTDHRAPAATRSATGGYPVTVPPAERDRIAEQRLFRELPAVAGQPMIDLQSIPSIVDHLVEPLAEAIAKLR